MKSEKEFMEGIYQKAKLYSEPYDIKSEYSGTRRSPKIIGIVAAAFVAMITIPAIINQVKIGRAPSEESHQIARASHTSSTVFDGYIQDIQNDGTRTALNIMVHKSYQGDCNDYITIIVDSSRSDIEYTFSIGELALFHVLQEDGHYVMEAGDYGKCDFFREDEGTIIYKTPSGEFIDSSMLQIR